jgi:sporulation protein YunB
MRLSGRNFRLRAGAPRLLRGLLAGLLVLLLAGAGFAAWRQLDRTMREYAAVWCGDLAARSVSTAMAETLAAVSQPLSTLQTDENGVVALQIDAAAASRLKAEAALAVSRELLALEREGGSIPLGTLLGSRLLMGRGPRVRFRLLPVGNAQLELLSRFREAGINQTCHQVVLQAEITVGVMLPGAELYRKVTQEAILSETVIVGAVPQVYFGAAE